MGLRRGSPLPCSINMRGGARGTHTSLHATTWKTLTAASSSQPNSETLTTREMLAHPRAAFHPCMCALRGGAVVVATALIDYDDVEVATETTTRRQRSWSTTSSTPTHDYVGSLLHLFFHCLEHRVITIYDLLLPIILRWYDRSSASVAYP
jgi:hypothetical protein